MRAARNRALRLPIVRGDLTVHAEHHLRFLSRHPGVPQRPAGPLYLHVGPVDNITHDASLLGTGTLIVSTPSPRAKNYRSAFRTTTGTSFHPASGTARSGASRIRTGLSSGGAQIGSTSVNWRRSRCWTRRCRFPANPTATGLLHSVVEVTADRQDRRRHGKSDPRMRSARKMAAQSGRASGKTAAAADANQVNKLGGRPNWAGDTARPAPRRRAGPAGSPG